jgi:hypothetical protein
VASEVLMKYFDGENDSCPTTPGGGTGQMLPGRAGSGDGVATTPWGYTCPPAKSRATTLSGRGRDCWRTSLRAGGDRLCFKMCYCNESDSLQIVRFNSISVRRLASILWIALKTVL